MNESHIVGNMRHTSASARKKTLERMLKRWTFGEDPVFSVSYHEPVKGDRELKVWNDILRHGDPGEGELVMKGQFEFIINPGELPLFDGRGEVIGCIPTWTIEFAPEKAFMILNAAYWI